MKFGICTSIRSAGLVRAAGWDYLEAPAQELLDDSVAGPTIGVEAANVLVPPTVKIVGPQVDFATLREHVSRIVDRAAMMGLKILVFGSGGARQIPEGFSKDQARQQIIAFARAIATIAADKNLTIALEPLNAGECNVINTIREAAQYLREVNHPSFRMLLDTYHFWIEDDSPEDLAEAAPLLAHVHVADKIGRVPPGETGKSDYRPLFRILKNSGYDSRISVEGDFPDDLIRRRGAAILQYLRKEWQES